MAFANLFTSLSAVVDEDATTPSESAVLGRKPGELEPFEREMGMNGKVDHAKERPLRSEQQSGSKDKRKRTQQEHYTRKQSNQSKRAKTHKAPLSYKDHDAEAQDYHMVKCGYEQPSLNFNKELNIYCHSDNADETNTVQNGSDRKNKNEYLQHKIKKCDSNQHSQSDRVGHSRECHQGTYGRDSHVKDRGGGANNSDKRIGRSRGCAIQGRDVPVKNDRSKSRGHFGGVHKHQRGGQQLRGKGRHLNQASYQCFPAERKRFMTQEFKEQNVLEVDGRLICRHFLHGRCIKGDECQLEHTHDVHNLIKAVCKFYVQGFCTKGENCPYMHKSFPCKFFHTRGTCFQGAECRFSHEPLTDLTRQLLEAALKRDNDINEMVKKDQLVNLGQPKNPEVSPSTEASMTPYNSTPAIDILLYPIRPNFYNSSCPSEPHTEKITPLCHTGGLANVREKDTVPHRSTDSTPAHSPPSSHSTCKEPVSYSVEAVLRSQKPKPLLGVFTSSHSLESTAHSSQQRSLDCPSISANQEEAPYSVDAVLGSRNAVEKKSICGFSAGPITKDKCTPPAQTRPCTTMTGFGLQEMPQPPTSLANRKVSYSLNTVSESHTPLESLFKSLCTRSTGQIPGTQKSTDKALYSVSAAPIGRTYSAIHHTKTNLNLPRDIAGPQDPIQPTKSTDPTMGSEDGRSKGVLPIEPVVRPNKPTHRPFHSLFTSPPSQTTAPKQLKQRLPRAPSGLKVSVQSPDPSLSFTDCKSGVAVPAETVSDSHKTSVFLSPGTEKRQTPRVPSGPQNGILHPNPNSTDCESKMTLHVESAVGSNKPLERPFQSLFASCISVTPSQLPSIQTKPDSIRTPLCLQESIDSTYSTQISTDCGGKVVPLKAVVEPSQATERPFLSLFASPISESAVQLPYMQTKPDTPKTPLHPQVSIQIADSTSSSRDCMDKTPNLKTSFKSLFAGLISKDLTDSPQAPRSLGSLPGSKSKKGKGSNSAEHINDSPTQLENPVCSVFTDPVGEMSTLPIHTDAKRGSSRTQADQLQPDASSHHVSSKTSTTNSILKTLFLHLSPCHLDEEQQGHIQDSVYSESENKDKNTTGSTFTESQWKREEQERMEGELREEMMQEPEICPLMDEPVEIPLEPSPCVSLCDPRHPLQVDVALLKPTFAHNVVWSPSDLIPLPPLSHHQSVVPQGCQELSIEKTITPLYPAGHLQEADSTSRSAGVTEVQLSAPGLHNLPIKSVAQMTQAHSHLPPNQLSGQNKCLKRNVGDKPLKEMFWTFDPTASPFGC